MKIAVLSDIHANVFALKAALDLVDRDGVDKIVHAGDLVGYGPDPNEVVSLIKERGIEGVRGNYDKGIGMELGACGCEVIDESDSIFKKLVFGWTDEAVTQETRSYLAELKFELKFAVGVLKVGVWHGTPGSDTEYWHEDLPGKFFRKMARKAFCDVIIFGHTHMPYHTEIGGVHFINAGSVGKPKGNDPRGSYAYLEIDPRRGRVFTHFPRVEYDVEAMVEKLRASTTLPETLADQFLQGI